MPEALPMWQGVNALALEPGGNIVLASVGATAVQLGPSGMLDTAFGDDGVVTASTGSATAANGVTVAPQHKLLLSGAATVNGQLVLAVIRLQG